MPFGRNLYILVQLLRFFLPASFQPPPRQHFVTVQKGTGMHRNEATSPLSSHFYTETYYEVTASFMIVTVATVLSTVASVNYHLQYRSSPSPSRVERILMKS